MRKLLLAGPGTGKTTKVKRDFLSGIEDFERVLVLSFTNATVNDLLKNFEKDGLPISGKNCMTLHSYAFRLNHRRDLHVLSNVYEENTVARYSKKLGIDFNLFTEMLSVISYSQMITGILDFAKTNPLYFKQKIGELDLLIVDEYQDFEENERQLINLLSENAEQTLILGDDDQAIYAFKKATPEGILALYSDPLVEKISHENICHRCPDDIVEKGGSLISKNKNRVSKPWRPSGKEGKIVFTQKNTQEETIAWTVDVLKKIREKKDSSVLVLAPVKFAIEGLPEALEEAGVPYVNFFGNRMDFEVYKKIWALRLIYTRYKLLNLILVVENSDFTQYKKDKFKKILRKYLENDFNFSSMQPDVAQFLDGELVSLIGRAPELDKLLDKEPYISLKDLFKDITEPDDERKLEVVDEFANPKTEFDPTAVNIMSIHKSKGLEATHVFVLGMVDGILPRTVNSLEEIEEERRRFFVALTRAKNFLYLLSTIHWKGAQVHQLGESKFTPVNRSHKYYQGQTSPFIGEMDL